MNKITIVILLTNFSILAQKQSIVIPSEVWRDNDGNQIQAHGGGIIKLGKIYYWYGEERRKGLDANFRYVSCYSSKNLVK